MNKTIKKMSITIESFDRATFSGLLGMIHEQIGDGSEMTKSSFETCDCDSVSWEITDVPVKIVEE